MIHKILKSYSDPYDKVTGLDTRLLNGLYQRKKTNLLKKEESFD